jgi:hypothetical protein
VGYDAAEAGCFGIVPVPPQAELTEFPTGAVARAGPRVQRAPGIPHALYGGKRFINGSGASRREIAKVYLELERRHCERSSQ